MKHVFLSEVAKIIMGQSPPSSTYNKARIGVPFFQGNADFGDLYPIPRVYCSAPQKVAEPGDILITVRAPVGPTNLNREVSCIGRGLSALRVGNKLDRNYLLYFLRYFEPNLAKLGTGSTFSAISRDDLENILLPLPPLSEQQRIAAILQKADRLRSLRRYARQLSDGYLQSVFLEMFGDPVTNPKGFPKEILGNVVRINPSLEKKVAFGSKVSFVPMVGVDEHSGKIIAAYEKSLEEVSKGYTPFIEKDVLFAKITPCMENGKSAIANNLINGVGFGSTEFHVIRPSKFSTSEWILWLVRRQEFRKLASNSFTGTAGQQRVPSSFLKDYVVPIPPINIQNQFVHICNKYDQMLEKIIESERQVEHLFQSLLQRAFQCEL